ncbi:Leu/Phe/Val dehydrogenase [Ornithinibacillus gellani]|uniref:Leu/Phe/Val dehydrogenase n=1 Tax=Ornithinibacillus gellani TaxID=2293253 RepID=UPI0037C62C75
MGSIKDMTPHDSSRVLDKIAGHEQVMFCNDPGSGLQAIIAIHNTVLGPALGGCRMYPYESLDEALDDVLRLSEGMTYKCAAADVDFGGGKAVIIGDPQTDKTPELFRAFGQYVETLNGRFYTGTDMGTTMDDFVYAQKETNCIVGVPEAFGGGGDSSIPTAKGVVYGLQATCHTIFGSNELSGRCFALQGLGKVGYKVAMHLLEQGAYLYVTDLNMEWIEAIQEVAKSTSGTVEVVDGDAIYQADADIFIPCAIGGVINDDTLAQFRVRAIAGSANNQLASQAHGVQLAEKGILYAPDYIINSGGLIQVSDELYGANKERVLMKTKEIYYSLLDVFQQAKLDGVSTIEAANRICEKRLEDRRRRNSFYSPGIRPKWKIRN